MMTLTADQQVDPRCSQACLALNCAETHLNWCESESPWAPMNHYGHFGYAIPDWPLDLLFTTVQAELKNQLLGLSRSPAFRH